MIIKILPSFSYLLVFLIVFIFDIKSNLLRINFDVRSVIGIRFFFNEYPAYWIGEALKYIIIGIQPKALIVGLILSKQFFFSIKKTELFFFLHMCRNT